VPGFFVVDAASAASIGCSLTIHRVESALLAETASWRTVPLTTIEFLIASNMNFNFESNRFFEVRHNAPGERPGHSLIDFASRERRQSYRVK
jgi:hypothetical protein